MKAASKAGAPRASGAPAPPLATFRLLFFAGCRLDRWESFEAKGVAEAIHRASRIYNFDLLELWSDDGRVASFRPRGRSRR